MFSFNNRYTKPYAGNIPNGFSLMARVPCARLTNRALQNCLVFLHTANTAPLPNQFENWERRTGHANPTGRNPLADDSNWES